MSHSGVITAAPPAAGKPGKIELTDGRTLVFFGYSCEGFAPKKKMRVEVTAFEPFHGGGLRATSVRAANEVAFVPDWNARTEAREKEIREANEARQRREREDERAQALVDQFERKFLRANAEPKPPRTTLPAPLRAFFRRWEVMLDAFPVSQESFSELRDPALIRLWDLADHRIDCLLHPEVEAALVFEGFGALRLTELSQLDTRLDDPRWLRDRSDVDFDPDEPKARDDLARQMRRAFISFKKRPAERRSDAALVKQWLAAEGERQAELGAVLLDFYEERGWTELAARQRWQLAADALERRLDEERRAFLLAERGGRITERAADRLLDD